MTNVGAPMTVLYAREPITDAFLDEALPLATAHWSEIAHYHDIPLAIDRDAYLSAQDANLARLYTVRAESSNVLVGYAVYFVRTNIHYSGSLQAVQDVLYVHPLIRENGIGAVFIAWCDEQMAAEGVMVVYHHSKIEHPQLGKVLTRLGYEAVETIYAKRLDSATMGVSVGATE
jgi:GNAT superfamily N-acetyltransferase